MLNIGSSHNSRPKYLRYIKIIKVLETNNISSFSTKWATWFFFLIESFF